MWYIRIGTRTTGPHSLEELKTLRGRGLFSPLHQISRDGRNWESAETFAQQLDAATIQKQSARVQAHSPISLSKNAPEAAVWYFLAQDRSQIGPKTLSELQQLIPHQLQKSSLVCKAGDPSWHPADSIPELASLFPQKQRSAFPKPLIIAGIAVATLLIIPLTLFVIGAATTLFRTSAAGNTVAGPRDELTLNRAVGLVVGTFRPLRLGERSETRQKIGTGTAFAITADGYLLTNDHVVAMADEADLRKTFQKLFETTAAELALEAAKQTDSDDQQKLIVRAAAYKALAELYHTSQVSLEPKLTVILDGVNFDARIVHRDTRQGRDMAILKIERVPGPFFALCTDEKPSKGSRAWVAGYPGVANMTRTVEAAAIEELNEQMGNDPIDSLQPSQLEHSLTEGIVNRVVTQPGGLWEIEHSIQINQGNSGGPMFREDGTAVGLINAYIKEDDNRQNLAQSIAQFRKDLEAHVPSPVLWRP
jgi:S1-C subfamily serine protease